MTSSTSRLSPGLLCLLNLCRWNISVWWLVLFSRPWPFASRFFPFTPRSPPVNFSSPFVTISWVKTLAGKSKIVRAKEALEKKLIQHSIDEANYLAHREKRRIQPHTIKLLDGVWEFCLRLAESSNQSVSYVVNRLLEAAIYGVPYDIKAKVPPHIRRAVEHLEERKKIEKQKRQMMEKFQRGETDDVPE